MQLVAVAQSSFGSVATSYAVPVLWIRNLSGKRDASRAQTQGDSTGATQTGHRDVGLHSNWLTEAQHQTEGEV